MLSGRGREEAPPPHFYWFLKLSKAGEIKGSDAQQGGGSKAERKKKQGEGGGGGEF